MRRVIAIGLACALGACTAVGGEPTALPPLAADREQPALALFEHVLTGYFAAAGANGPTVCAALRPAALSAAQEKALIERFVRLAPAARCVSGASGPVDAITGDPAQMVQVYDFACASADACGGWVQAPGAPATRYAMRFEGGAWKFDGDRRIIGE